MAALDQRQLRDLVARLAAIERGSATPGEREAAELIAAELDAASAPARVEEETVHGTYWLPIGILTGLAALAGASRSRALAAAAGAFAAAAVADDVRHGRRWFRRAALPRRTTWNVTAEVAPAGDAPAERTVVVVAHHDAARTGLVFHPELPRAPFRRFPGLIERTDTTPPTMWGAFGGPLLVALGALLGRRGIRRAGTLLSAGYAAAMADVARSPVVPGANDNLTGVAAVVSLAHALRERPLDGVRVLLVSTGSEESFSEGMQAWGERHFGELAVETTDVLVVDTIGSPRLLLLEGEGMLGMTDYPRDLLELMHGEARRLGIDVMERLRFRNATDGIIALHGGYRTAMLGSVDEFKTPTNYHWPTDTPENVDYGTVEDGVRLLEATLRAIASEPARALEGAVERTA